MKTIFLSILLAAVLSGCEQKNNNGQLETDVVENPASANGENSDEVAAFKFERTTHDFGTITDGEKISYAFKFKNTGKADLLITNARGSCGCTVPNYPKMPIKPGDSGVIDVTFDSNGRAGHQSKQVTIVANTIPNTSILTITGEVIPKKQ